MTRFITIRGRRTGNADRRPFDLLVQPSQVRYVIVNDVDSDYSTQYAMIEGLGEIKVLDDPNLTLQWKVEGAPKL